jgi:hypothetical protein
MLVSAPALSTAQTRQAESQIEVSGTVEAVDHAGRTVTIRMQPGNLVTLDVPPTAGRFEQVKIGDTIKATYYDQVSIRMKPAGEPPVDRMLEPIITATPGTLPGATRTRQRVTTVTITGWDRVNKVVSFTDRTARPTHADCWTPPIPRLSRASRRVIAWTSPGRKPSQSPSSRPRP